MRSLVSLLVLLCIAFGAPPLTIDSEIFIGVEMPFNGPLKFLALQLWKDVDTAAKFVNADSSILPGSTVRLVPIDTQYDQAGAISASLDLLDNCWCYEPPVVTPPVVVTPSNGSFDSTGHTDETGAFVGSFLTQNTCNPSSCCCHVGPATVIRTSNLTVEYRSLVNGVCYGVSESTYTFTLISKTQATSTTGTGGVLHLDVSGANGELLTYTSSSGTCLSPFHRDTMADFLGSYIGDGACTPGTTGSGCCCHVGPATLTAVSNTTFSYTTALAGNCFGGTSFTLVFTLTSPINATATSSGGGPPTVYTATLSDDFTHLAITKASGTCGSSFDKTFVEVLDLSGRTDVTDNFQGTFHALENDCDTATCCCMTGTLISVRDTNTTVKFTASVTGQCHGATSASYTFTLTSKTTAEVSTAFATFYLTLSGNDFEQIAYSYALGGGTCSSAANRDFAANFVGDFVAQSGVCTVGSTGSGCCCHTGPAMITYIKNDTFNYVGAIAGNCYGLSSTSINFTVLSNHEATAYSNHVTYTLTLSGVGDRVLSMTRASNDCPSIFIRSLNVTYTPPPVTPPVVITDTFAFIGTRYEKKCTCKEDGGNGVTLSGFVGPFSSNHMIPAAYVGSAYSTPVWGAPTTASDFSNKNIFPTFSRVGNSDLASAAAFANIFLSYGWKRMGLLYVATAAGDSYGEALAAEAYEKGIAFSSYRVSVADSSLTPPVENAVNFLIDADYKIFIVYSGQSDGLGFNVVNVFLGNGLFEQNFVLWCSTGWAMATYWTTVAMHPDGEMRPRYQMVNGNLNESAAIFMALDFPLPSGPIWEELNILAGYNPGQATVLDAWYFDSVYAQLRILDFLQRAGLPPTVTNYMSMVKNVSFLGASSMLDWNENTDKYETVDILNYNGTNRVRLAQYYAATQTITAYAEAPAVIWPNGKEEIPVDAVSTLLAGDVLPFATSASVVVLAFALSVVGSWMTLILLEQVFFLKREKKEYMLWLLLAAVALTIAGIWAPMIVGLTSIDLSVPVSFNEATVFPSFLAGAVPVGGCFILMITTVHFDKKRLYTKDAGSGRLPSSESLLDRAKSAAWVVVDWRIILSSLLLTAGAAAVHFVSFISLTAQAHIAYSSGKIIAGLIVCFVLGHFALCLFFHLRTSQFRVVGAFVMAGALMSLHFLASDSVTYTYKNQAPPAALASLTLRLIASLFAAVLTLIFMGVNIDRLKLSRNHLDRMVLLMASKYVASNREVKSLKQKVNELEVWLDLINRCRPGRLNHFAVSKLLRDTKQAHIDRNQRQDESSHNSASGVERSANSLVADINTHDKQAPPAGNELELLMPQSFKLLDVLSHPVLVELLKDRMTKSLNVENLMFLLEVTAYRKLTSKDERKQYGTEIFNQFLKPGAPQLLNIQDNLHRRVVKRVNADDFTKDTFQDVVVEIFKLVQTNDFSKLTEEKDHKMCTELLHLRTWLTAGANEKRRDSIQNDFGADSKYVGRDSSHKESLSSDTEETAALVKQVVNNGASGVGSTTSASRDRAGSTRRMSVSAHNTNPPPPYPHAVTAVTAVSPKGTNGSLKPPPHPPAPQSQPSMHALTGGQSQPTHARNPSVPKAAFEEIPPV